MLPKLFSVGAAVLVLGCSQGALAQHWHGRGGHFDFHNGHIDYHQPTHWDFHGTHFDLHRGHVDHIYPSYYPSTYYYPRSSLYYGTNVYGSSNYSTGSTLSATRTVVSPPSLAAPVSNAPPTNALPGNTIVTGFAPNQGPINITNPEKYGTALSFMLNGQATRLDPGQTKSLKFDRNYIIEFHRGGDFGIAKYSLRDGEFQFKIGDKGWDLNKVQTDANNIPKLEQSILENPLPTDK